MAAQASGRSEQVRRSLDFELDGLRLVSSESDRPLSHRSSTAFASQRRATFRSPLIAPLNPRREAYVSAHQAFGSSGVDPSEPLRSRVRCGRSPAQGDISAGTSGWLVTTRCLAPSSSVRRQMRRRLSGWQIFWLVAALVALIVAPAVPVAVIVTAAMPVPAPGPVALLRLGGILAGAGSERVRAGPGLSPRRCRP